VIKSIMQTLAMFKGENHDSRQVGQGLRSSFASFEEPTRYPDVWPAPPPKDPDVWSGPTHAQQAEPGVYVIFFFVTRWWGKKARVFVIEKFFKIVKFCVGMKGKQPTQSGGT
jgi:hypothetical protein